MNPEGRQTSNVPEAMDTVVPTTQQLTPTTPPPGVTPRPSRPPTRRFMTMTSRAISVRYVGPRRSLQSTRPYRAAACPSVPNQPRALPPPMRFGMPPRGQAWLPGLGHRIPVKTMAVTSATPLYKDTRPKLRSTHTAGACSFMASRPARNAPATPAQSVKPTGLVPNFTAFQERSQRGKESTATRIHPCQCPPPRRGRGS